jgi:hypothetical protein
MTDTEDETVSSHPFRISGVMAHYLLEQKVRYRCKANSSSGMAIADILNSVSSEDSRCVDSLLI